MYTQECFPPKYLLAISIHCQMHKVHHGFVYTDRPNNSQNKMKVLQGKAGKTSVNSSCCTMRPLSIKMRLLYTG